MLFVLGVFVLGKDLVSCGENDVGDCASSLRQRR